MSRSYWSPFVQNLLPYTPGEQPQNTDLIKLNTNENAYGVSPKVIEALHQTNLNTLRLYPDPQATQLCQTLAELHQLNPENIFVGNGSDEILGIAFYALLKHEMPVLFPDLTYSFYPVYCNLFNIPYKQIPLTEEFRINLQDYSQDCAGIVIANPNAPTGIALEYSEIEYLLKIHSNRVVLIDEAYVDFGGQSVIPLIRDYPNLLVMRTFSKFYALAGLRVGYAVGHPHLIEGLIRVKDSFNSYPLDRLAQIGAIAAVKDVQWSINNAQRIIHNREKLSSSLQDLGFQVLDSKANFIFATHPQIEGALIAKHLKEKNIFVRHFTKPSRIKEWLRITIGTKEECQKILENLQEIKALLL